MCADVAWVLNEGTNVLLARRKAVPFYKRLFVNKDDVKTDIRKIFTAVWTHDIVHYAECSFCGKKMEEETQEEGLKKIENLK